MNTDYIAVAVHFRAFGDTYPDVLDLMCLNLMKFHVFVSNVVKHKQIKRTKDNSR